MAYEGVADELAVTLVDMGADNFAYIGTRATGPDGVLSCSSGRVGKARSPVTDSPGCCIGCRGRTPQRRPAHSVAVTCRHQAHSTDSSAAASSSRSRYCSLPTSIATPSSLPPVKGNGLVYCRLTVSALS